jgi:arylsulfatase A
MKNKFILASLFWIIVAVGAGFLGCRKLDRLEPTRPVIRNFDKPNVIIVLGDDIGYEVPHYTGGESYSTPNMDRLASLGMQFTRCYSTPLCSPSRYHLLTGKYNFRNYFADSWGNMGRDQYTIANLMRDNGYATYAAGKWQLGGGDTSLQALGFNEYAVTNPFKLGGTSTNESEGLSLYKNPVIYTRGNYIADALTLGKYGEDVMRDSVFSFMERNKEKPFFVYWAPNLCHQPFQPTPDDPAYAGFDPSKPREPADTIYHPGMVRYYDKELGMLYDKVVEMGISQKTLIFYLTGDNGTEADITSRFKGEEVPGGKGKSLDAGIHIAVLAVWPGVIQAGSFNRNIVDFTDFYPTIANLCNIKIPASAGVIDGVNFAGQLLNEPFTARKASYCYYDVNRLGDDGKEPTIWSFDTTYKLYDERRGFYNFVMDPYEVNKIRNEEASPEDAAARDRLQDVIDSYR